MKNLIVVNSFEITSSGKTNESPDKTCDVCLLLILKPSHFQMQLPPQNLLESLLFVYETTIRYPLTHSHVCDFPLPCHCRTYLSLAQGEGEWTVSFKFPYLTQYVWGHLKCIERLSGSPNNNECMFQPGQQRQKWPILLLWTPSSIVIYIMFLELCVHSFHQISSNNWSILLAKLGLKCNLL